jgi:predicted naringenin-chalcone synthase
MAEPQVTVLGIERFCPPYRYDQETVTRWVKEWLSEKNDPEALRLLSVYSSAGVKTRASVLPIEEVFFPRDFESQNDRYVHFASEIGIDLARRALRAAEIAPSEVDLLVSVSCTGFMIPALEAHVADALEMGPRLVRLPITESGCAGGVVGLARARDYLIAHPRATALVLAVELSSLTFQRWDLSPANVVSSALFGDGGAAVVLVGPEHPRAGGTGRARITRTESHFFRGTKHLMGFRLRNQGLQIVLDRNLTPFLSREVLGAVSTFLTRVGVTREAVSHWILHPGGRRIIEVMAEKLGLTQAHLAATEAVLQEHGNMSSVTVLFVLDEIMRKGHPRPGDLGVLGAFGPGFGAEFALLEFS